MDLNQQKKIINNKNMALEFIVSTKIIVLLTLKCTTLGGLHYLL